MVLGGGADGQRGAAGIGSFERPVDRGNEGRSYSANFSMHCMTENRAMGADETVARARVVVATVVEERPSAFMG